MGVRAVGELRPAFEIQEAALMPGARAGQVEAGGVAFQSQNS